MTTFVYVGDNDYEFYNTAIKVDHGVLLIYSLGGPLIAAFSNWDRVEAG